LSNTRFAKQLPVQDQALLAFAPPAVSDPNSKMFASPALRTGWCLSAIVVGLAALSFGFPYGVTIQETPLLFYIGLALIAGGLWSYLPRQIGAMHSSGPKIIGVLLIGLVMRGAMFISLPVLEDDSYRYLWDGAVTAHAIDPYKYAPADASSPPLFNTVESDAAPTDLKKLQALATAQKDTHERINYPYIATIYPPLTQAAFAFAYSIDPFGLTGWRLTLLVADLVTFWLLIQVLKAYQRSPLWVSVYWWNPVVLLQGFGAGHMDLLVLPFLLGSLALARANRSTLSAISLAGAAAVKIWPILLLPVILRQHLRNPLKLGLITLTFAVSVLIMLLPQLIHVLRPEAGLNAYASEWRTHAFLFSILEDVVFVGFEEPGSIARLCVAALIVKFTGYVSLRYAANTDRFPILFAAVIACLIFLSPTGYPWYLIWLAPFVAFCPHPGLLSLFALTPLYWLRFQLGDDSFLHQWVIVPIAFGVPITLLSLSLFQRTMPHAFDHHHPSVK